MRRRGGTGSAAAIAAAAALALPAAAGAATITVNTTDDDATGSGDCELREALSAANTNAAVDGCVAPTGATSSRRARATTP